MTIAAIILAAGRSSRFEGGNKLLADYRGGPLIHAVMATVSAAKVDEIVFVISPDGQDVAVAAGVGRWHTVVNPDAVRGLSTSLQAGLAALSLDVEGALVVLADMPGISADLLTSLVEAFDAYGRAAIVYPRDAAGRQGNPVLWPRGLFPELMKLSGDQGGKKCLETHVSRSHAVTVGGPGAFVDIDTRADLERLRDSQAGQRA